MAKISRTAETHPVTFGLWAACIGPIVEWCEEEHGRRAQLLQAYRETIAPETVSRQIFDAWIAKPENRTEPSLSNGMALMATAGRLGAKIKQPTTSPP